MLRKAFICSVAPAAAVALSFASGRRGVASLSLSDMRERETLLHIPLPQRYLNATAAREIDEMLMSKPGFSIDQLMELAGLSVAKAAHAFAQDACSAEESKKAKVLILCGPGNNGGDGLVAARHLRHFGYSPAIVYPKKGKTELFSNLVTQCEDLGIPFLSEEVLSESEAQEFGLIIDSFFGFSFKGPLREPFGRMLNVVKSSGVPTISVDIPSGWDVDSGDIDKGGFMPEAVISLTAPKQCMVGYQGEHFVGGRFVPPSVQARFQIDLPDYGFMSSGQVAKYSADASSSSGSTGGEGAGASASGEEDSEGGAPKEVISVVYVTASSEKEGEIVARAVISRKLAACVNIIPKITSVYEWEGKVEKEQEVLLMIKAPKRLIPELTKEVQRVHSYDVPEVIALDVEGGSNEYISWVGESCPPKE